LECSLPIEFARIDNLTNGVYSITGHTSNQGGFPGTIFTMELIYFPGFKTRRKAFEHNFVVKLKFHYDCEQQIETVIEEWGTNGSFELSYIYQESNTGPGIGILTPIKVEAEK
jgi:hypothetical protein